MILLLLALLLFSATGTVADNIADPVLLRYRVPPGDSSAYDIRLHTGMAVRGMASGAGSELHSVLSVYVSDSTELQLGIDVDVLSMKASMRGAPGMRDTTVDLVEERDMKLRVIIDRKGTLLFAWPSAELVKAHQTGGRLAGGGVQNSLRKIFLVYPDDSLRPGSTWQTVTSDTSSAAGNTIVTRLASTLTYTGIADTLGSRCARISIASDSVVVEGKGRHNGSDLTVGGRGSMAGTYYIDVFSGMPVAGIVRSDIDMTFSPSEASGGAPVRMHNTSDMVLRRTTAAR